MLTHIKNFLLTWGLPGLFFIALLDSAGVPMVGGPDAVVMLLSWQRPALVPLIALAAALGSTVGCWALYRVGRTGGELALARFAPDMQDRVRRRFERNDLLAVFVAVIAPPPSPTKLFILAAGVVGMRLRRFLVGVFVGRVLRYSLGAFLGARYGDQAAAILRDHYPTIAIALILVVLVVFFVRRWSDGEGPSNLRSP